MGAYDSHFTGRITITPPLPWAWVRDVQRGLKDLRLVLEEEATDTATGRTTIITGVALAPLEIYHYNGSAIEEEIQATIDAHPGHEFTGMIEAQPEDPAGLPWRYVAQDRTVVRQEARLMWGDAEAARGRARAASRRMFAGLMPGATGDNMADEVADKILAAVYATEGDQQ